VSSAADGDLDLALAGETHRLDDVGRSNAADEDAGSIQMHRVERPACVLVPRVARRQRLAAQPLSKCCEGVVVESRRESFERMEAGRHGFSCSSVERWT
jgi:hypothetical protein